MAPCVLLMHALCTHGAGLLFPQDSESREVKDVGGLWRFKPDYMGQAAADRWQANGLPEPTMLMPVPCSYNDMTQERALRDLVGTVWYERDVFIPLRWLTHRVSLYVGSANYHAQAALPLAFGPTILSAPNGPRGAQCIVQIRSHRSRRGLQLRPMRTPAAASVCSSA